MLYPMLRLMATQPELLAEHAGAYAELVAQEIGQVSAGWTRRTLLNVTAICFLGVATALAGVAVMLWAVTPHGQIAQPWILMATPVPPILLAVWCYFAADKASDLIPFDTVRQQMTADMAMLREAGIP